MSEPAQAISHSYLAGDGCRLNVDIYRSGSNEKRLPAVCLPGLTRSAADFSRLAAVLAKRSTTSRDVYAFDYRGRGRSDHDIDPSHYNLTIERDDFLSYLGSVGITAAHFVGTSRGGLHVMELATLQRDIIGAVVLNDIGPVLKPAGLQRIKDYVGVRANPRTVDDAIRVLKNGAGRHFDGLSYDEWQYYVRTTFGPDESDLHLRYDPALARTLDAFDLSKPLPDLWEQYDALHGAPVLTIRGANSDLLSATTHAQMADRWHGCASITVQGQGHAPLLADDATLARIDTFLAANDGPIRS